MTLLTSLLLLLLTAPDQPAPAPNAPAPGPPSVTLESIDGASIESQLLSIDASGILTHRIGAQPDSSSISLNDLARITQSATQKTQRSTADHPPVVLHMADGGRISAGLVAALDGDRGVRVDAGLPAPLDVPFTALAAVRLSAEQVAPAETELSQRLQNREPGRDILIAMRDGKPVILPGVLERITPQSWTFRIGDKPQTGSLDKAYAIVLSRSLTIPRAATATVELAAAGSIAGEIQSADASRLTLNAGSLGMVEIPWSCIHSIALRSGRIVHLSELEPTGVVQKSLFDMSWPPRKDRNVTGGPMILSTRRYDRGLGVHAYTALTYNLGGEYEAFTAVIGIDESVAPLGRAIFRIRVDDKTVYDSGPIGQGQATAIKVELQGAKVMTLECDPGDDLDISDHCNWAAARLVRAKRPS